MEMTEETVAVVTVETVEIRLHPIHTAIHTAGRGNALCAIIYASYRDWTNQAHLYTRHSGSANFFLHSIQ